MFTITDVNWSEEVLYWLLFFFFNFSLFASLTIVNFNHRHLNPFKNNHGKKQNPLFFSFNPDFYRICVDLSLIILFFRWFSITQSFTAASLYYSLLLTYSIYHNSFSKIYQVYPIISNDFRLIINAAGILWSESKSKVLFFSSLALFIITGLAIGFKKFLVFGHDLPPNQFTFFITSCVGLYVLIGLWRYGIYRPKSDTAMRVLIFPLRIAFNLLNSWRLRTKLKSTNFETLDKQRNIQLNLKIKPNIYCLFIESYGSILLKEEKLKTVFLEDYQRFESALESKNWIIKTNLSESVTPVGPSWLAYTSVLFGSRITNNFEYEFLLNKKTLYKYDTLMKVFMKEGYQSYHLNGTKPKAGVMVPYQQMSSFFGIDKWILEEDLPYSGPVYGFAESPADQYVLNFAQEQIKKEVGETPFILFYLTKNSHSPFISPSSVVADWKSLNNNKHKNIGQEFLKEPSFEDYQKAITYQLDFIGDFIVNQGGKNDIFLLMGDHQPHVLGDHEKYGRNTIVHIISQNRDFSNSFNPYGFKDSPDELNLPIKHEAIYSMFVREMIRNFGKVDATIPPYEKEGVSF